MRQLNVRIPDSLYTQLRDVAQATGAKQSELVRNALEKSLQPVVVEDGRTIQQAMDEARDRRRAAKGSEEPRRASPPERVDEAEVHPDAPPAPSQRGYTCHLHPEFSASSPNATCWCNRKVVPA